MARGGGDEQAKRRGARAARGFWRRLRPGDRVETHAGDHVGDVLYVRDDAIAVKDPVEGRELLIPRDACAPRDGGGVRLVPQAVRAAGGGPERYVRRPDLADEWVAEQTAPGREMAVEREDPLKARRARQLGDEVIADDEDVGAAVEHRPSEV